MDMQPMKVAMLLFNLDRTYTVISFLILNIIYYGIAGFILIIIVIHYNIS